MNKILFSSLVLGTITTIFAGTCSTTVEASRYPSNQRSTKEVCSPKDPAVVKNLQLIEPYKTETVTLGSVTFDKISFSPQEHINEVWEVCGKPAILTNRNIIYFNGNTYSLPRLTKNIGGTAAVTGVNNTIAYQTGFKYAGGGSIIVSNKVFDITKVKDIRSFGKKLAVVMDSQTGTGTDVWFGDKKLGTYKRNTVSQLTLVSNTLAYTAVPVDDTETNPIKAHPVLYQNGKLVSDTSEYVGGINPWGDLVYVTNYRGYPAYVVGTGPAWESTKSRDIPVAPNRNTTYQVMWRGKKISDEYPLIINLQTIGGKLAFLANVDRELRVIYDGQELSSNYVWAGELTDANGKPAYMGMIEDEDTGEETLFLVRDKEVLASAARPYYFSDWTFVQDKLAYTMSNTETNDSYLMYGGEKILVGNVSQLATMGNKLTFVVQGGFLIER